MIAGFAILVVSVLCVVAAERMAANRARSPRAWMRVAAFLGPLPLALPAILPMRRAALGRH